MTSMINLIQDVKNEHTLMICVIGSGPLISRARNELLAAFLESQADLFLSVDSDITFTKEDLDKLIASDKPIVGAHYVGLNKRGKFPVANIRQPDGFLHQASYKLLGGRKGLRKVDAVGMGFTLIKREVIEALGLGILWPYAEVISEDQRQMQGEDVTFCLRAAEKGYETYINLDAKVGHLKSVLL